MQIFRRKIPHKMVNERRRNTLQCSIDDRIYERTGGAATRQEQKANRVTYTYMLDVGTRIMQCIVSGRDVVQFGCCCCSFSLLFRGFVYAPAISGMEAKYAMHWY